MGGGVGESWACVRVSACRGETKERARVMISKSIKKPTLSFRQNALLTKSATGRRSACSSSKKMGCVEARSTTEGGKKGRGRESVFFARSPKTKPPNELDLICVNLSPALWRVGKAFGKHNSRQLECVGMGVQRPEKPGGVPETPKGRRARKSAARRAQPKNARAPLRSLSQEDGRPTRACAPPPEAGEAGAISQRAKAPDAKKQEKRCQKGKAKARFL